MRELAVRGGAGVYKSGNDQGLWLLPSADEMRETNTPTKAI